MPSKQNNQISFGDLFKKMRKDSAYTIDQLAEETKIPKRHIESLEYERFDSLPPTVYVRGFIIKCCDVFDAEEEKHKLLRLYSQQGRLQNISDIVNSNSNLPKPIFIGPRHMGILATAAFSVFLLAYFLINFVPYIFSPEIILDNLSTENLVVNFPEITIVGTASHIAELTLNGKKLYIGENGVFEETFGLKEGVNILKFEAASKLGRDTELVRRVVYIKN